MTTRVTHIVTTKKEVYIACPTHAEFIAKRPSPVPLTSVWWQVGNDVRTHKSKQKKKGINLSNEDAYASKRSAELGLPDTHSSSPSFGDSSASPPSSTAVGVALPANVVSSTFARFSEGTTAQIGAVVVVQASPWSSSSSSPSDDAKVPSPPAPPAPYDPSSQPPPLPSNSAPSLSSSSAAADDANANAPASSATSSTATDDDAKASSSLSLHNDAYGDLAGDYGGGDGGDQLNAHASPRPSCDEVRQLSGRIWALEELTRPIHRWVQTLSDNSTQAAADIRQLEHHITRIDERFRDAFKLRDESIATLRDGLREVVNWRDEQQRRLEEATAQVNNAIAHVTTLSNKCREEHTYSEPSPPAPILASPSFAAVPPLPNPAAPTRRPVLPNGQMKKRPVKQSSLMLNRRFAVVEWNFLAQYIIDNPAASIQRTHIRYLLDFWFDQVISKANAQRLQFKPFTQTRAKGSKTNGHKHGTLNITQQDRQRTVDLARETFIGGLEPLTVAVGLQLVKPDVAERVRAWWAEYCPDRPLPDNVVLSTSSSVEKKEESVSDLSFASDNDSADDIDDIDDAADARAPSSSDSDCDSYVSDETRFLKGLEHLAEDFALVNICRRFHISLCSIVGDGNCLLYCLLTPMQEEDPTKTQADALRAKLRQHVLTCAEESWKRVQSNTLSFAPLSRQRFAERYLDIPATHLPSSVICAWQDLLHSDTDVYVIVKDTSPEYYVERFPAPKPSGTQLWGIILFREWSEEFKVGHYEILCNKRDYLFITNSPRFKELFGYLKKITKNIEEPAPSMRRENRVKNPTSLSLSAPSPIQLGDDDEKDEDKTPSSNERVQKPLAAEKKLRSGIALRPPSTSPASPSPKRPKAKEEQKKETQEEGPKEEAKEEQKEEAAAASEERKEQPATTRSPRKKRKRLTEVERLNLEQSKEEQKEE